jgi:hypothetical protein
MADILQYLGSAQLIEPTLNKHRPPRAIPLYSKARIITLFLQFRDAKQEIHLALPPFHPVSYFNPKGQIVQEGHRRLPCPIASKHFRDASQ